MRNYKHYCDNIENVENYNKAKADDFNGWDCHHRLETHTSDGERRLVDLTVEELIALGMYWHRPAEEAKRKMSEAKKGKHWFNNGTKNIRAKTCPEGFVPGRLKNLSLQGYVLIII